MRLMRVLILFILCTACVGPFKKTGDSDTFVTDSEFLRQGNTIEDLSPSVNSKKNHVNSKDSKPNSNSNNKNHSITDKDLKDKGTEKKSQTSTNNKSKPSTSLQANKKDKTQHNSKDKPLHKNLFFPGEKVILSATYFGVEAGKITLGVDSMKKFNGDEVFHFYAFGRTSSVFSLFYGVKDKIESLWSPSIEKPVSLAFDVKETKQKYKTRTYFYWDKGKADYIEEGWERGKGNYQGKKEWKLPKSAQDIVSAVFYIRTLPLKVGDSFTFNVLENEKVIQTTIKVDRAEVLGTREGDFNTLVLKPSFKTKGKFKKVGDISIWITNDHFKQVIRVESKIKIGTIIAKLYQIHRP